MDGVGLGRVITIVLGDDDVPEIYVDGVTLWAVPAILHAALVKFASLEMSVRVARPDVSGFPDTEDEDAADA